MTDDIDDDRRRTDAGRTPDHEYPISSPMSLLKSRGGGGLGWMINEELKLL